VIAGGDFDPGDLRQVRRQEAALERARDVRVLLEQAGVLDRRSSAERQLLCKREVGRPVYTAGVSGRHERDRAEDPVSDGERNT